MNENVRYLVYGKEPGGAGVAVLYNFPAAGRTDKEMREFVGRVVTNLWAGHVTEVRVRRTPPQPVATDDDGFFPDGWPDVEVRG